MKYPIRNEFKKYSVIHLPVKPSVLKIANAMMPIVQKGKRLDENLKKQKIELPHCTAELIAPMGTKNPPLLVYYHGGAFLMKAAAYHKNLMQTYAKDARCAVLFVDYRLAPKYKFPTSVDDCFDAYKWALRQGYSKIMVGGDSAGANLALAAVQMAYKANMPLPRATLLIYPVCDTRMQTESAKNYTDTPLWNGMLTPKALALYANEANWHDPLMSPAEADDLSFMPPTYIETAEFDCLHDEGINFAERLKSEGVSVTLNETIGTIHGYDIAEQSEYVKEQIQKRIMFLKNT